MPFFPNAAFFSLAKIQMNQSSFQLFFSKINFQVYLKVLWSVPVNWNVHWTIVKIVGGCAVTNPSGDQFLANFYTFDAHQKSVNEALPNETLFYLPIVLAESRASFNFPFNR